MLLRWPSVRQVRLELSDSIARMDAHVRALAAMAAVRIKGYVAVTMIHILDIDPRIARHCLRAGRLHTGV